MTLKSIVDIYTSSGTTVASLEEVKQKYISNRHLLPGVYAFEYDGSGREWNKKFTHPEVILKQKKGEIIFNRYLNTLSLLNTTLDYYQGRLPKTILFISLMGNNKLLARHALELGLPICVMSCAEGEPFFIFPDGEYQCYSFDRSSDFLKEGDDSTCYNWDEVKKIALENMTTTPTIKKKQIMYYRGIGSSRGGIRTEIEKTVENNPLFDVKISTTDITYEYEPFYQWSKYAYLLDLPGGSNVQLKNLFLCDSVVVRVVSQPFQRQFLDLFVKPGREYLSVAITDDDDVQHIVEELEKIAETNPRKYSGIRKKGFETVSSITNEVIYKYIRKVIFANNMILLHSTIGFHK